MTQDKTATAEPRKSLGSKIKDMAMNAIFKTERIPIEQPKTAPGVTVKTEVASAPAMNATMPTKGVVNMDLKAKFRAAVESRNKDGYDFIEFERILDRDKSIREVDKYTRAFDTIKALDDKNPTPRATLIETGNFYVEVLEEQRKLIEKEFEDLMTKEVGPKQGEHDASLKELQDMEEEKKALEQRIREKSTQVGQLQDELSKHNIELNRKRLDCIATLDEVVNEYRGKISNIEQHLVEEQSVTEETKSK